MSEEIKPGWPEGMVPPDYSSGNLLEVLAKKANADRLALVDQLLSLIKQGDSTAWKILEKALVDSKPKDEKNKPIPILGGITQNKEIINQEKEKI